MCFPAKLIEVFVKKYVSLVNSTNLSSLVCILNRYYHIAHIGILAEYIRTYMLLRKIPPFVCLYKYKVGSVWSKAFYILFSFGLSFICLKTKTNHLLPSITDGVHRNENLVEIIPVFSSFSNFFIKKNKIIKAIICNFSMRLLKCF